MYESSKGQFETGRQGISQRVRVEYLSVVVGASVCCHLAVMFQVHVQDSTKPRAGGTQGCTITQPLSRQCFRRPDLIPGKSIWDRLSPCYSNFSSESHSSDNA
jgi:hypothetical protein